MQRDRYTFSGEELEEIHHTCTLGRVSPESILRDRQQGGDPHPIIQALAEAFEVHYTRIENVLIGQSLYAD